MSELSKLEGKVHDARTELKRLESLNQNIIVIKELLKDTRKSYYIYSDTIKRVNAKLKSLGIDSETVALTDFGNLSNAIYAYSQNISSIDEKGGMPQILLTAIVDAILKELSKND